MGVHIFGPYHWLVDLGQAPRHSGSNNKGDYNMVLCIEWPLSLALEEKEL